MHDCLQYLTERVSSKSTIIEYHDAGQRHKSQPQKWGAPADQPNKKRVCFARGENEVGPNQISAEVKEEYRRKQLRGDTVGFVAPRT